MGKKKNLAELDDYEKGYIEAKMSRSTSVKGEIDSMISAKRLSYKIELKCKQFGRDTLMHLLARLLMFQIHLQ